MWERVKSMSAFDTDKKCIILNIVWTLSDMYTHFQTFVADNLEKNIVKRRKMAGSSDVGHVIRGSLFRELPRLYLVHFLSASMPLSISAEKENVMQQSYIWMLHTLLNDK